MTATDDSISIREHLETALKNQREYVDLAVKRVADSVVSLEKRVAETNDQHNLSHSREHGMTELAVKKAEEAMSSRLEAMNEFRGQITDERGRYLTKDEFQRFEESLGKQVDAIEKSISGMGKVVFGSLIAAVTLITMLVTLWARLG